MAKKYSLLESKVLSFFKTGTQFNWNQKTYEVLFSGKPRTQGGGGEPKTDCYVKIREIYTQQIVEIKISCKIEGSNEFQENKISSKRAAELFGPNWSCIIRNSTALIASKFNNSSNLNNPEGYGRLKNGHITLGWKLEIANKKRVLSAPLQMGETMIRDYIYKGLNQEDRKKDAIVNDNIIKDSGVANYILITSSEKLNYINDVLTQMEDIDNHMIKPHHLIFTANNYRIKPNKTDGNRPLAVRVEWKKNLDGTDIIPVIKFDSPLVHPSTSSDMKKMADQAISQIPDFKSKYI